MKAAVDEGCVADGRRMMNVGGLRDASVSQVIEAVGRQHGEWKEQ
ncbi:MAG: hypothetical protein QOE72_4678 [Chloroflexota bacterium]|nr:hypothetical protein [Chloroflexota bacterium]